MNNDIIYDVFISYEHESKTIADKICANLEKNSIRCWYAPRDVIGDYASSIVNAINKSKIFILILSSMSSKSPHVLNEIEIAYKLILEGKIQIIPFKVDNEEMSQAMEYYVKRLHWIDAVSTSVDEAINELIGKVKPLLNIPEESLENEHKKVRFSNKYFEETDEKEKRRLLTQTKIMSKFDLPIYNKIISGKENLVVLDVGSNDGRTIMDRLGNKDEVVKIIGLECNEQTVTRANISLAGTKAKLYTCDIEDEDFPEKLHTIMIENQITSFDIIHLSMIILHLKNPFKVLKNLRRVLKPGGLFYIMDIDDGFNIAYPDENKEFERVIKICNYLDSSGYRQSGRQIYSYLKKIGLQKITLEKQGINTIGMNYEERDALFNMYFSFIPEDFKIMATKSKLSKSEKEDLDWLLENYDCLEEKFHSDGFFFTLGILIYTAF